LEVIIAEIDRNIMLTLRVNIPIVLALFIFIPSQSTAFDLGELLDNLNAEGLKRGLENLDAEIKRRNEEIRNNQEGPQGQQEQQIQVPVQKQLKLQQQIQEPVQQQTKISNSVTLPPSDGRPGARELKIILEEYYTYSSEMPGYQPSATAKNCLGLYNKTISDGGNYHLKNCSEDMKYALDKVKSRVRSIAQEYVITSNNLINYSDQAFGLISDYPHKSDIDLKIERLKNSFDTGFPSKIRTTYNDLLPDIKKLKEVYASVAPASNKLTQLKKTIERDLHLVPNYPDRKKIETTFGRVEGAIRKGSLEEIRSGISVLESYASNLSVEVKRVAEEKKGEQELENNAAALFDKKVTGAFGIKLGEQSSNNPRDCNGLKYVDFFGGPEVEHMKLTEKNFSETLPMHCIVRPKINHSFFDKYAVGINPLNRTVFSVIATRVKNFQTGDPLIMKYCGETAGKIIPSLRKKYGFDKKGLIKTKVNSIAISLGVYAIVLRGSTKEIHFECAVGERKDILGKVPKAFYFIKYTDIALKSEADKVNQVIESENKKKEVAVLSEGL